MSLQQRSAPVLQTEGGRPLHPTEEDEDDEEEPEIGMGSFMSGDPNFNRETSDSQSMTKALNTLKAYLSSYAEMKRFRPAMLVFLHSLLARKEAKWYKALNYVFFDWLADDWKTVGLQPKQSKRTAFAIYSTFLNREGPLSLEGISRTLDPGLGLGRPSLVDPIKIMSQLFAKRPMDSQLERIAAGFGNAQANLQQTLEALTVSVSSEIQTKRRDGFVSDILPGVDGLRPDLSDERQQRFIDQCRNVMLAHVKYMVSTPFGGPLEAGCLASLLERLFRLRIRTELPPDLPQFNVPRPRSGGALGFKGFERRGTHLLKPVELDRIRACSACGKLLCGPGPQGLRCRIGDCQVVSHGGCLDGVKPIACSSAAGLIKRAHNDETQDSAHAYQSSADPRSQASGRAAPKAPARSFGSSASLSTVASAGAAADAEVVPPSNSTTAPPPQIASMPQISLDVVGSGAGGHRGSVDSGQDVALLSPYDLGGELYAEVAVRDDAVSKHPDIGGVPADFQGYIESSGLGGCLAQLRPASGSEKDAERFRDYQLALHEVIFSSQSHLRALTLLDLLFVQPWPQANRPMLQQLGLHFVTECIALYRSLHNCIGGGDNLDDFKRSGRLERFGERLLNWYSEGGNALKFQQLGLSFGFAKVNTRRKTASINEDDIILRLIGLRREDPSFNRFFARAEAHPAMNKRRFVDLYSVNMQQTMRMVTLLETAARKARKAKEACEFADKDAENLEKCVAKAKVISEYCNNTGTKLKELSRQLVLSKSFSNFWERSLMDESRIGRFRDQVSHLHTCELHVTREVFMPGLEGYRLRLFVFTDFLLVISETDEARGVKYQLLKQLGPSLTVDSQQQQQAQPQPQPQAQSSEMGNLIETNCPPVIPMDSVVHIFDTASETRRRLPGSRVVDAEFRIIVEQVTAGAPGASGTGRVKPLMLEFRMSQEKPRLPFFATETQCQATDFVECIRGLAPRLTQRLLDRHASLSGSAVDLTSRVGSSLLSLSQPQSAQHLVEHRRVHSSAGVNVPRPPPASLLASATRHAAEAAATDESEGEAAVPADKEGEKEPGGQASRPPPPPPPPKPAAPQSPQQTLPPSPAAATLSAGLAADYQARLEATLREQQTVLPVALGLNMRVCQEAQAMSQSENQPSRPEKILLAWRLMAEASTALTTILPVLKNSGSGASCASHPHSAMIDSSLRRLSSLARATADCLDRETQPDPPVEIRRGSTDDFDSKFRLSRVSEVSGDSQTQPLQDLLLTARRSQISTPPSQPTTPNTPTPQPSPEPAPPMPPPRLPKPAKASLQQLHAAAAVGSAAVVAAEASTATTESTDDASSSDSETESGSGDSSGSEYSEEPAEDQVKVVQAGSRNSEV